MTPGSKQRANAQQPLKRIHWNDIREPGAYVEVDTGALYRIPREGAAPIVERGGQSVPAAASPERHSRFVRVSRDPFIFSLGARLICVDHDIQPRF